VVTSIYDIAYPPNPPTTEIDVALYAQAPAAPDGLGYWTARDVRVVAPDARDGSATPIGPGESNLEPDPNAIRALAGVGVTRWMDATQGWAGNSNFVLATDPQDPAAASWRQSKRVACTFQFARRYVSANSPRVYGPQSIFNQGPDDFGRYLTVPPGDDGAWAAAWDGGVIELRSTAPHGLVTGRTMTVWCPAGGVPIPMTGIPQPYLPTQPQGFPVYVTGPTTILATIYARPFLAPQTAASAQPQRMIGTDEVDLTAGGTKPGWSVYCDVPAAACGVPYRYPPAFAARLPGSALWVDLPVSGTDDLFARIARETAEELGPSNKIYLELGNEVWNGTGGQQQWLLPLRGLGVGPRNGDMYGPYVPMAAAAHDVFTRAAAKAGVHPSRVETVYGSWFSGSYRTAQIVANANALGARVDHVAVAPYHDTPADPTIVAAFATWPPDAINDFTRHVVAYSATYQRWWQEHALAVRASTQAKKPDLVCYEGGYQTFIPGAVPGSGALTLACLAHPSARDLIYGWFAACQQGDQTMPDGGATLACYYQCWNVNPPWILSNGVGRDTPALQGLRDWCAAAGRPAPTPTP
jgi:hypothetical protein